MVSVAYRYTDRRDPGEHERRALRGSVLLLAAAVGRPDRWHGNYGNQPRCAALHRGDRRRGAVRLRRGARW